jgi:hypothetical protein
LGAAEATKLPALSAAIALMISKLS